MFIVNGLEIVLPAPEERNIAKANVAFKISLLWSFRLWVT
jgi:hypothetical protein